ncbi:MAG: hypothetical protein EOO29_56640 [Comamonadaceae bacterium]|nr:MAG: hypothetical protein EOO29_56640 [Comamonadaceae bacterium]
MCCAALGFATSLSRAPLRVRTESLTKYKPFTLSLSKRRGGLRQAQRERYWVLNDRKRTCASVIAW